MASSPPCTPVDGFGPQGKYFPKAKIGSNKTGIIVVTDFDPGPPYITYYHVAQFLEPFMNNGGCGSAVVPTLTVAEAAAADKKMDDGDPSKGNVKAQSYGEAYSAPDPTCATGSNYNFNSSGPQCALDIRILSGVGL